MSQLAKRQDQAVNFTKWGFYYAFDIMGLVGLGTDFSMVDTGMEHEVMTALHGQMIAVGVLGTVPWLLSSLSKLPITGGFDVFIKFCIEHLDQKIKARDNIGVFSLPFFFFFLLPPVCHFRTIHYLGTYCSGHRGLIVTQNLTIFYHGFLWHSTKETSLRQLDDWLSRTIRDCSSSPGGMSVHVAFEFSFRNGISDTAVSSN